MKKLLTFALAMLMCVVIVGTSLAEYGYTKLSQIPAAVDFTFDVTFDEEGLPHIVTDYPYKETGAEELNLTYNKGDIREAAVLNYNFITGETCINCYNGNLYSYDNMSAAYDDIRNGVLTLDNAVCINTTNNSLYQTDWVLTYSIPRKTYIDYEEKTNSQGHNAMGAGGERKLVSFNNGVLTSSYYQKRIDDGDLCIVYNEDGSIQLAYIDLYKGENKGFYDYNESTGLFSGKKLSELGFDDSDINQPAPAALGDSKDPSAIKAYVARCYENILGREAAAEEMNTWFEGLSAGKKTAAEIADQLATSAEFKRRHLSFADMVDNLCKAMLNRPAEATEKTDLVNMLKNGQRLKAVMKAICETDGYKAVCETSGLIPGTVKVPVIIKK